jgi:hypothetical protein
MNKCKPGSPAAKLMRGHHAHGGEATPLPAKTKVGANPSNHYAMGGAPAPMLKMGRAAPNLTPKYSKGGHPTRRRAAGGHLPELESKSAMHPQAADKLRRGGRSRHAAGEEVEVKRKRGGRAHQSREHHFLGSLVGAFAPMIAQGVSKLFGHAHGGEIKRAMGGVGKKRKNYPFT